MDAAGFRTGSVFLCSIQIDLICAYVSEPARALIRAIRTNPASERGQALTQYLAVSAHPNFACNLAELQSLSGPDQRAVVVFSEYYLKLDMLLNQQGTILRATRSQLADMHGIAKLH